MDGPLLHVHEPRLGRGLPARTVRPYARRGDAVLAALLGILAEPAERVVFSGRLFESARPPAHLVDRLAKPLGALVARGVVVHVPADTPCALLFLAAGVRLGGEGLPATGPEFHRTGAWVLRRGESAEVRRADLPGARRVRVDVTGLSAQAACERIRRSLQSGPRDRFVTLVLVGETSERELRSFGPRELLHHLPGGADGNLENRVVSLLAPDPEPGDEAARRTALRAARERLPPAPETTGVYEFVDGRGRVLYVGKAVNLRRRVGSHYTAELREPSPRGPMLRTARDLRCTEVGSEVEALLLEAERIRELRPPYNRHLRESEAVRYLRAGLDDPRPGLSAAAEVRDDGAAWFGPFGKRWVVERAIRVLQVVHGFGDCDWTPGAPAPRACTDRALGICAAPCRGGVGLSEYRERVRAALADLRGETSSAPAFGALNAPGAGLLGREDLRIYESFARSFRWLLATLAEAHGEIALPDGSSIRVSGGLCAGTVPNFMASRTWVPPDRMEEVRILARALRRSR